MCFFASIHSQVRSCLQTRAVATLLIGTRRSNLNPARRVMPQKLWLLEVKPLLKACWNFFLVINSVIESIILNSEVVLNIAFKTNSYRLMQDSNEVE
jgi:hypothetical protein